MIVAVVDRNKRLFLLLRAFSRFTPWVATTLHRSVISLAFSAFSIETISEANHEGVAENSCGAFTPKCFHARTLQHRLSDLLLTRIDRLHKRGNSGARFVTRLPARQDQRASDAWTVRQTAVFVFFLACEDVHFCRACGLLI